jgi:hypothetical protein
MNIAMVQLLLQGILALLQNFGVNSNAVNTVITTLIGIVPYLSKEYEAVKPIVAEIIEIVSGSDVITDQQMTDVVTISNQVDTAFDKAVSDYQFSHGA